MEGGNGIRVVHGSGPGGGKQPRIVRVLGVLLDQQVLVQVLNLPADEIVQLDVADRGMVYSSMAHR